LKPVPPGEQARPDGGGCRAAQLRCGKGVSVDRCGWARPGVPGDGRPFSLHRHRHAAGSAWARNTTRRTWGQDKDKSLLNSLTAELPSRSHEPHPVSDATSTRNP